MKTMCADAVEMHGWMLLSGYGHHGYAVGNPLHTTTVEVKECSKISWDWSEVAQSAKIDHVQLDLFSLACHASARKETHPCRMLVCLCKKTTQAQGQPMFTQPFLFSSTQARQSLNENERRITIPHPRLLRPKHPNRRLPWPLCPLPFSIVACDRERT